MPRAFALLLLPSLLLGCAQERTATPPAAAPVLPSTGSLAGQPTTLNYDIVPRIFEAPAGRAGEIKELLSKMSYPVAVTSSTGVQTQFVAPQVNFTAGNTFVVTAPAAYHAAIEGMLAKLAQQPAAPTRTFDTTYWTLRAAPAATTRVAADLAEIEPALRAATGLGARSFTLIDRASGRVDAGAEAHLAGRTINVKQEITATAAELSLEVMIQAELAPDRRSSLDLDSVRVTPGQPVILGDAALPAPAVGDADASADLVLHVVLLRPAS